MAKERYVIRGPAKEKRGFLANTKRLAICTAAAFLITSLTMGTLLFIKLETEEIKTDAVQEVTEGLETFTLGGMIDADIPQGYEPFLTYQPNEGLEDNSGTFVMFGKDVGTGKEKTIQISLVRGKGEYETLTGPSLEKGVRKESLHTSLGSMYFETDDKTDAFAAVKLKEDLFLAAELMSFVQDKKEDVLTDEDINEFTHYLKTGVTKH